MFPPWTGSRPRVIGSGSAVTLFIMRIGIADHLGWAVAVTASADHEVVDRRRIEPISSPGCLRRRSTTWVGPTSSTGRGEPLDDTALAAFGGGSADVGVAGRGPRGV